MNDKKWEVVKTFIIAVTIVFAAFVLANAIDQAGLNIANQFREIATEIRFDSQ